MGGDSDNTDVSTKEFLVQLCGLNTPRQSWRPIHRRAMTSWGKHIFNYNAKPETKRLGRPKMETEWKGQEPQRQGHNQKWWPRGLEWLSGKPSSFTKKKPIMPSTLEWCVGNKEHVTVKATDTYWALTPGSLWSIYFKRHNSNFHSDPLMWALLSPF